MTADAMMGTRDRCLKAGMDDFVSKPINQDEFHHILGRWVTFADEAGEDGAAFDLSGLSDFADDVDRDLRQLINLFVAQSKDILEILQDNCRDGENQEWVEAAHKLKGGASLMKAKKLCLLCDQAQKMESATANDRKTIVRDIETEYRKVRRGLEKAVSGNKKSLS